MLFVLSPHLTTSEHPHTPPRENPNRAPSRGNAGATVLVRLAPSDAAAATRYRAGMISDANDDGGNSSPTYDVIYDEAEPPADQAAAELEEDEEDGVAADRVLGVPASPCVWCAARLNLARCSFRRGRHAEVRRRRRNKRRVRGSVVALMRHGESVGGVFPCCFSFLPSCVFAVLLSSRLLSFPSLIKEFMLSSW